MRALIHSGERSERLTELLESKDPEVRAAAIRGVSGRDGDVDPVAVARAEAAARRGAAHATRRAEPLI